MIDSSGFEKSKNFGRTCFLKKLGETDHTETVSQNPRIMPAEILIFEN
jgi:hypothetical protein